MLEIILSALAEFGLIREDYKHHKRISNKETKDGIKRPFQKYLLQPSVLLILIAIVVGSISAILFFSYQRTSVYPEKTKKEISDIVERIDEWHEKFGRYPTGLDEIIGNSPIKQDWLKDPWNQPYKYIIVNNGEGFLIISASSDGIFETEDDIKSD